MNIKIVKLVTNEEVVCEYKEEDDENVILENPILMMVVPSEEGMGIGLAHPWMIASQEREFKIKKEHVVCAVDAPEDLRNAYSEAYGSGIVTARDLPDEESGIII